MFFNYNKAILDTEEVKDSKDIRQQIYIKFTKNDENRR